MMRTLLPSTTLLHVRPASEAGRYSDRDVCLLGGGNSAGQAAMLLARHARRVLMIMAEDDLESRM